VEFSTGKLGRSLQTFKYCFHDDGQSGTITVCAPVTRVAAGQPVRAGGTPRPQVPRGRSGGTCVTPVG
jgi:hypothetical protein